MKAEEFNTFFKEKQKKNPDTLYLTQLSIANYYCDKEQMEFLSQVTDTKAQLLFLTLLTEGYPLDFLNEIYSLPLDQVKRKLIDDLYEKDGIVQKKERLSLQIEHLKNMVANTKTMEDYLKLVVTQKDSLIQNQEKQIQELRQYITEQKKDYKEKEVHYERRIKELSPEEKVSVETLSAEESIPVEKEDAGGTFTETEKRKFFTGFFRKRQKEEVYLFLDYLKENEWSQEQADFLIKCHEKGMTVEEIQKISAPGYSVERMELLKKILETESRR